MRVQSQDATVGGSPVYVLPSTSGLNARTSLADLVAHLRAAAGGPVGQASRGPKRSRSQIAENSAISTGEAA